MEKLVPKSIFSLIHEEEDEDVWIPADEIEDT